MGNLFSTLTRAVEGTPLIALLAALAWGVLSILLSPCHLASIPLIVGFITQQGKITTRRAFGTSALFSLGILCTIGIIGLITAALGRMAGDIGGYGNYIVAVIFFVVGLSLLDVIPLSFSGPGRVKTKGKGLLAAFMLGFLFGIALGPCTFAYMAPVLGVTFRVGANAPLFAAALLTAYGIGHCSVIVIAGTSTQMVRTFLRWNEASPASGIIKKICGVLVLAGGLYLIYTAP
ncbi:MAG: cytochrome C biogenesis protein [Candidatus Atribacteria bacterium]|nr:cytochrome C biogenesis protein [Candidatus Atribacteria bacterium]